VISCKVVKNVPSSNVVQMSRFWDGTTRAWDVESGKAILGPIETGHQYMLAVAYSSDGNSPSSPSHASFASER